MGSLKHQITGVDAITEFQGQHRWLSNFWPAKVGFGNLGFPTVEHAYQAAKSRHDPDWMLQIQSLTLASQAKRMGKSAICTTDWRSIRLQVMLDLLRQKFMHKELRDKLIATGDAMLVEGNNWNDHFWGVDWRTGEGKNFLGTLLMMVREEYRWGR